MNPLEQKSLYAHCAEISHLGGMSRSDAKKAAARANLAKARRAKANKQSMILQEQAQKKAARAWQTQAY